MMRLCSCSSRRTSGRTGTWASRRLAGQARERSAATRMKSPAWRRWRAAISWSSSNAAGSDIDLNPTEGVRGNVRGAGEGAVFVTRARVAALRGQVRERSEPPEAAGLRGQERRRYARLEAPILYRSAPFTESVPRRVTDVSLGGARVYTDVRRRPGERLEVELFPPEAEPFIVRARVVWVQAVAPGGPALYDVGLKFTDASAGAADKLRAMLEGRAHSSR